MSMETIFWLEIVVIIVQLLAIYVLSRTLIAITTSDLFKEKLLKLHKAKEEPSKKESSEDGGGNLVSIALLVVAAASPLFSFATSVATPEEVIEPVSWIPDFMVYVLLAIILVLTGIILYFRHLILTFLNIDRIEEAVVVPEKERVSYKVMHALTDAVSLEDEESVLTDHEYDGIHELDNNLPPWWKWGFYLSIVFAVVYLTHYHVIKTGDLQHVEYAKVIEAKEIEIAAYLESKALNVDENSVVALTEDKDLMAGKGLFGKYCAVCHLEDGGGQVGPNLTDPYWIYDGDIKGIFSTIKYGAKRGMKSWKDELNPVQMQKLASYILTLQGTTPAAPKPPEGELFEQQETAPTETPEEEQKEEELAAK